MRESVCVVARPVAVLLALVGIVAPMRQPAAYTAVGDRNFPATITLPQLSPTDEFYLTPKTLPKDGGRQTDLTAVYNKLLTERLGIALTGGRSWLDQTGTGTQEGWQNLSVNLQYLAALDPAREMVLSFGAEHEFGATGTARSGANRRGATTMAAFLGKGFGDLDIGYLRPFAVTAMLGYQLADSGPRPDQLVGGFVLEYSIPYLESKVKALGLPEFLSGLTPLVELQVATPLGDHAGNSTTVLVAPGFNFSGEGWDFGVEALLPTTRATGRGAGVAVQLHLSLDYLFPTSVGKPLFPAR